MKLIKQAGTAAIASALLLANVPQAWAGEAPAPISSAISALAVPVQDAAAQAEVNISREKALELAKTYIDIPDGYALQSVNLNILPMNMGSGTPTWNLFYSKRVKEEYLGDINIAINGMNGKLMNYHFNDSDPSHKPGYPPKVDYQGAKDAAAKWIAKLNPDEQNQLLYNKQNEESFRTPLNGNYTYLIRYDRSVDGVPYPQDGVTVTVNGDGAVTGYSSNWDDKVTFEKVDSPISQEKAIQAFRDQAEVSLVYQIPYQSRGVKKPIISYSMSNTFVDAASGEIWNPNHSSVPVEETAKPLTDKPLGEKPSGNLKLTKEQAVERVNAAFTLPGNAKLGNASYNEFTNPDTGENNSSWNLNWVLSSNEEAKIRRPGDAIWASVNSQTGEIMNFNHSVYYPVDQGKEVDVKVSRDTAKAQAIDFVKKNLPAYTDQLVLDESIMTAIPLDQQKTMPAWSFNFKRVIDGVEANHETVNMSIDKTTGEITNYYQAFTNLPYPQQKPEVLPLDQAKDLLLSQYAVQLAYVPTAGNPAIYGYGGALDKFRLMASSSGVPAGTNLAEGRKSVAKLVYMLVPKYTQQSFFLDAATGQWRDASTGDVITLDKIKVTDIDGHWAQNELQLMVDYRAIDVVDGKVNPNKPITRGEMIKMLVIAMNGGNGGIYYGMDRAASTKDVSSDSPYFAYVENAVDRGLVDRGIDFNPNATMNREELAQLIVRALGYKNLTKYNGIFNDKFNDAADLKNIGDAAIVVGLNIMSLTEGSFHPSEEVTRAQAAAAFFRYLQKRAELQDNRRIYY